MTDVSGGRVGENQANASRGATFTVRFERWKRRGWTCRICGLRVGDTELHAQWHAERAGFCGSDPRPQASVWEPSPESLTLHVNSEGQVLR